jgi:sugar phosphate isomerase/epimerase
MRALDAIGYKGPVNLQCFEIKQPAEQHLAASLEAWKKLNRTNP